MQNILIPTNLSADTLVAVETALTQAQAKDCNIVLLLIHETPGTASAAGWLRRAVPEISAEQESLLDKCFRIVAACENCKISIHRQYAVSTPLFSNLLKSLGTEFAVIPHSFSVSSNRSEQHSMKVLANLRYPLLQLTELPEVQKFERAFYLEKEDEAVGVNLVQKIIRGQFAVRIVGQIKADTASVADTQLYNAIHKNEVDLLVETRKPQRIRFSKKPSSFDTELGLPVLSICEPLTS